MAALSLGINGSHGSQPKSVAQVTKDAQDYEYNALVPMKYWLRSATALIQQAEVYIREGDDEMTYFLLFRHAHLVLTNLETHSEAKIYAREIKALNAEVNRNLKTMDILKPRLKERYDQYQMRLQKRARQRDASVRSGSGDFEQGLIGSSRPPVPVKQLRSGEDVELEARLAEQEFTRHVSSQRQGASTTSGDDLSRRMQDIRMRVDSSAADRSQVPQGEAHRKPSGDGYSYPSVPVNHLKPQPQIPAKDVYREPATFDFRREPAVPPKIGYSPALPPKQPASQSFTPSVKPDNAITRPAVPSKEPAEPKYSFAPEATLENGIPLRTIFLPPTLRTTFLRLAHKNTLQNLETCGFLAGTLRANALFVTTLIVPCQTATSDTCEMTNESDLFDFVDQRELMVLGWIHTHPTQTCFMSSRDLHTHAGYQMMLAESIAIVCAPSKGDVSHGGDWGVYRLTDPPGKMAILQCEKPGTFHPHDVDNIYTDAKRPGHVREIPAMDFEIVDLRESG